MYITQIENRFRSQNSADILTFKCMHFLCAQKRLLKIIAVLLTRFRYETFFLPVFDWWCIFWVVFFRKSSGFLIGSRFKVTPLFFDTALFLFTYDFICESIFLHAKIFILLLDHIASSYKSNFVVVFHLIYA